MSTVVSEVPLQQEEGVDGAPANDNDDSGPSGQAQGLQDNRYGLHIMIYLYIHTKYTLVKFGHVSTSVHFD